MNYQLIPNSNCCLSNLPLEQQWIGVTIFFADPEDGTSREKNVYWHEGEPRVTLTQLDPLTIEEEIKLPGQTVTIKDGKLSKS